MSVDYLKAAGALSFFVSLLHLAIIAGGPAWYRFFGAGEHMAKMAEQGAWQPTLITLAVACVLALWGAYAWSAAGILRELPLLRLVLVFITAIYLMRGFIGLVVPFISNHPQITQNSTGFWVWSSLICLAFGLIHLKGIINRWFV